MPYNERQSFMIKRASARRMKSYYRILKTLIRLALIVLAGACVYHFGFGMAFDEAIYFCIVTGTTVGYGDVLPMTDNEKIFTIFFMLFGVAGVSQVRVGNAARLSADKTKI